MRHMAESPNVDRLTSLLKVLGEEWSQCPKGVSLQVGAGLGLMRKMLLAFCLLATLAVHSDSDVALFPPSARPQPFLPWPSWLVAVSERLVELTDLELSEPELMNSHLAMVKPSLPLMFYARRND
ncbi:hypothetical protein AK812_SmicGene17190 [Symbiodinium microadriaticum]|uniref:Uncharacterized protein n=1 Tax=Symbiodinium microadriaticum TaxID=2951 RepID=A0A1Q9DYC7_SYMMI|nr:hypothetical protein AK812_SmicGene17190 [Symbiodinium microadriaticum]